MKIAFVIGNGHSRTVFDVTSLKDHGVTYGCNLLIKDMQLDNTVACDRNMLIRLISEGYDKVTNLWTRPRWRKVLGSGTFNDLPKPVEEPLERDDQEIHWGSGTHAVNLAATQGADVVVMLGFDLWQRQDGLDNIYQDDPMYGKKTIDPTTWIYQLSKVFDKFPDTSFVQIQPKSWSEPENWANHENYSRDDYGGLRSWIKEL